MATVDGLQCTSAETSHVSDCVDDIPLENPQGMQILVGSPSSGKPEGGGADAIDSAADAAPGLASAGDDAQSAPGGAGQSPSSSKSSSAQAMLDAFRGGGDPDEGGGDGDRALIHLRAPGAASAEQKSEDPLVASGGQENCGDGQEEAVADMGCSTPQHLRTGEAAAPLSHGKKHPIRLSWLGTGPKSSPHPKAPSPKKELKAKLCEGKEEEAEEEEEEEQNEDDVDAITELLLDPRKTRHAITKGAYAGKELRVNPMVKEALNLIISSPSPKVSALIRQHRKLERLNGIHAPSLAFSPHKSSTFSSSGQRNRWGSAADRAALATLEAHNRISKALSSPNKQSSAHTPAARAGGSMDTSLNGEPLIQGLQDSPASSNSSPHPASASENQPPSPLLSTPPALSGLQADDSMLLEPLPGLQDDALDVCTSPEAEAAEDPVALREVESGDPQHQEEAPPKPAVAEPKVLRFKALEHLDLVESLVEEMEFIARKAAAADRPVFGHPTATKLGEGLEALRGVQISVIHDSFESAKRGVGDCGDAFSRGGYDGAQGDLEKLIVRVEEAESRARNQAEELETLDDDNRKMFEAVRGNDALQKAGFCLADERYDHALAFIARAEGAFLRSGAGEGGGQEDGMLAFLRDMTKRVVHSKASAETKAKQADRSRQYTSGADLVVRSRGDTAAPSSDETSRCVKLPAKTASLTGSGAGVLTLETAWSSTGVPHMVGPVAGVVQEVTSCSDPAPSHPAQPKESLGAAVQPSRFGALGQSASSVPKQHWGVQDGVAERSSSSGGAAGGAATVSGPVSHVLKQSGSWSSGGGGAGKENRWGVVSGNDFRSTPQGTPTKMVPRVPPQYQQSPDVDATRGFGGGLVGAAADLPSIVPSVNDMTNV